MKVLNLSCTHQHVFEGWFASEDDFIRQRERGQVSCPLCGDAEIHKMLSAPRLNLRAVRQAEAASEPADGGNGVQLVRSAPDLALQASLLKAMRAMLANSEDVGERFADQARAMHHGDIDQRNIRGRTSPEVALELIEEGIDVMPLPALPAVKETLQ
jgi:hypothetical protein